MAIVEKATGLAAQQLTMLRVLTRTGIIKPYPPHLLLKAAVALARWGLGPAGGFRAQAILNPDRAGLVDDLGELSFRDLDERSNALADALARRGVGTGDGIAIMARNHRGFVDATVACAKLGASALYLNTAFAAPQIAEVLDREQA
ncbi:MAG: AMP-binding protein, partial [Nocardioidaceae bacterium]